MDAQLKIIVGAEIADVEKKLQKLEKEAESLRKQLEKPINANVSVNLTKDLDKVNAEIAKLRQQKIDIQVSNSSVSGLKSLADGADRASSSLTKLKQATPNATFALTNLSRVAQDAPFGFIGIANNIDPLIQSFIQLKQQSGSTKGALLALGSSLAGPGGLVLLTGLATAAMTLFGDKLLSGVFGASQLDKKLEELRSNLKSIQDVKVDSFINVQGDVAYVNSLARAVSDANKPYAERKRALDELKKVNKEYFGDLTVESAAYGTLAQRVNEYSQQIVQQAVIKGLQDQITENTKLRVELEKRLKVQKAEKDTLEALAKAEDKRNKQLLQAGAFNALAAQGQSSTGLFDLILGPETISTNLESKLGAAVSVYTKTRDELEGVLFNISDIQGAIDQELEKTFKLRPLTSTGNVTKAAENVDKLIADIKKKFAELKIEIPAPLLQLPKKEQAEALKEYLKTALGLKEIIALQKQSAREEAFKLGEEAFDQFQKGIEKEASKVSQNPFLAKLGVKTEYDFNFDNTSLDQKLEGKLQNKLTKLFQKVGELKIDLKLLPNLDGLNTADQIKALESFTSGFETSLEKANKFATTLTDRLTPAIDGFVQSLLSGSGSPVKAFVNALKQLAIQFVATIAKAIVLRAILSALPGGQAFSFSGAIQQGISNFAGGNIGGTSAGSIRTGNITGAANVGQQQLITEVRGSSLALILQRTSNTRNRLG